MVMGAMPWPRDLIQITAKEDKVFRDMYGCNAGSALQVEFLKMSPLRKIDCSYSMRIKKEG